jgi:hypothetical protein
VPETALCVQCSDFHATKQTFGRGGKIGSPAAPARPMLKKTSICHHLAIKAAISETTSKNSVCERQSSANVKISWSLIGSD